MFDRVLWSIRVCSSASVALKELLFKALFVLLLSPRTLDSLPVLAPVYVQVPIETVAFFCPCLQVMPALREKHDEFLLRELVKRWDNHKVMVRWLSRFFNYLDRYFVTRRSLPVLNDVGLICFRDLVS